MAKTNGSKNKPVAGYYRISQERDGMLAPHLYEEEIRRYCDYKKLTLHEPMFHDIGISGRAEFRHKRKGLDDLLARRHEFSAIIIPRLNRFGRSVKDLASLFETFDNDDIALVFLDFDIDTSTSTGRLLRNIMASLAEFESERISETWKDTHAYLRREGRTQGGGATPYGYTYLAGTKDNQADSPDLAGKLIINPDQAVIVREIYERFLQGESLHSITNDLNGEPNARNLKPRSPDGKHKKNRKTPGRGRGAERVGRTEPVPTQRGGRWSRDVVGRILENPTYAGLRPDDKGELIEAQWDAIVERKTWEQAAALRAEMKRRAQTEEEFWEEDEVTGERVRRTRAKGHRPTGTGTYVLTGLLFCGACGSRMHHKGNQYVCPNQRQCREGGIADKRAERLVSDAFAAHLTSPKVRELLQQPKPKTKPKDSPSKLLQDLEKQMDRLITLQVTATGPLAQKSFEKKLAELEQRRVELEAELTEDTAEEVEHQLRVRDISRFFGDIAKQVPELWEDGPLSPKAEERYYELLAFHLKEVTEQRDVLKLAIDRIVTVPETRPKELLVQWVDGGSSQLSAPVVRRWQKKPTTV